MNWPQLFRHRNSIGATPVRVTSHIGPGFRWALGIIALLLVVRSVESAVPQAGCLFYGQVLDEYGWPFTAGSNVQIVFRVNGKECGRGIVDAPLAPGVNFVAMIRVDDGQGEGYTPGVSVVGDQLVVVLCVNGAEVDTITVGPQVGAAGSANYIKVRAGVDSDGDGLPDAWEQFLVDYYRDDAITNIINITPEGDFDGDGATNREEYLAGTFPEHAHDRFAINEPKANADGWFEFSFLSVPGMPYSVESCTNVLQGSWSPCLYSLNGPSNPQSGPFSGNGGFMTIYVAPQDVIGSFYRLVVK